MKLKKNKKSFELGFQHIIIILILIIFAIAVISWYLHLQGQGDSFLANFFKR